MSRPCQSRSLIPTEARKPYVNSTESRSTAPYGNDENEPAQHPPHWARTMPYTTAIVPMNWPSIEVARWTPSVGPLGAAPVSGDGSEHNGAVRKSAYEEVRASGQA